MIDFPAAPVAGQIFFASNGAVYQYNSTYTAWVQIASSVLQDATFFASATGAAMAPSVVATYETVTPTVTVGNAGGWYNAGTGVFTPPAGRYLLLGSITFNSSAGAMLGFIRILKNGVTVDANVDSGGSTPFASGWGTLQVQAIVNANGTDTFAFQTYGSVLMSNAFGYIGAFPLSQAAQIPGGGSSWRQIARTVVAAPQATIDFQNIPTDINDIELRFDITPVTDATDLILRWYDAGGVLLNAGYGYTGTVATNGQALASAPAVANNASAGGISTGVMLNYVSATRKVDNAGGARGRAWINNIRDATRMKAADYHMNYLSDDGTVLLAMTGSGWRGTAGGLTGLQLALSSGNFAAGSTATLWGSP